VGLQPYPVQIAGALGDGRRRPRRDGDRRGQDPVAVMPAVLAGWRGRGCHVVTANEYLARRDAKLMQAVYTFCGLTVGLLSRTCHPPRASRPTTPT